MTITLSFIFFRRGLMLASLAAFCFGSNSPARDVTVNIAVGNALQFFPAVTNVATGDNVIWIWDNNSNLHSTTATAMWDSGLQAMPFSFTNNFNAAGTFPYFCSRHQVIGMTGAVIVAVASLPPSIAITNPISGAVFAAPANVTIQAAATSGSSAVTNVQFLIGVSLVTNEATAPFSIVTNNLAAGSYTVSAVATDNNNLKATNSVNFSVVVPSAVMISGATKSSPTNFQFNYSANAGLRYIIQRSTNLLSATWLTLITNIAAGNPANFSDTNAIANPGFYRVGLLPNP